MGWANAQLASAIWGEAVQARAQGWTIATQKCLVYLHNLWTHIYMHIYTHTYINIFNIFFYAYIYALPTCLAIPLVNIDGLAA